MYKRYALYFTPQGALAALGASWLGWDVAQGASVAQTEVPGLDVATLTQTPRKYGFHGTIKPPFALAQGKDADALIAETEVLCRSLPPVTLDGLTLVALGRFLALVPLGDQSALAQMAGTVVQTLDGFRAPPTDTELARRRQARLTPAQEDNLLRWGYPYVMDQFRFHLTLTSKLPKAQVAQVREAITPMFQPHLDTPYLIDTLTVVGEREDGMFEEIRRYPLTG